MDEALWALGRGTGVVALVCFTISVALGIVARSGRAVGGVGRFGVAELHRTAALTGTGLIVVHVASLMLDPYAQLELVDAAVPFLGDYRPVWQGLGTLALDLLLVVVAVSLLRDRVGPRVFRAVHLLTWAMWPVSVAHAVGNGTDRASAWMVALVVVCVGTVVAALAWRNVAANVERGQVRIPRQVAR